MSEKILVTKAYLPSYEEYIEAIKPLWNNHWITNMGEYHKKLEDGLKEYLRVSNISLMVNGHMALELAIQAFDFPEGSEIITTPFTFISTTHAIVRNHLKPVFCDVKETDGTIDEAKIEELITEKTVGIVPVHVYGHVCNVEKIQNIANKYNLKVIYDAAHAFGVEYKGKGIGSYGDATIFSFHATKVFNSIEGGAVAFSDTSLYDKLYNLKNFGIRGEELVTEVGANAKMNEFCAIMGLCNLRHIEEIIESRKKIADEYTLVLEEIKGLSIFNKEMSNHYNYSYYPILVDEEFHLDRDQVYELLRSYGIYTRKYFYPITSDQACFKNKYKSIEVPISRKLAKKVLVLPMYADMSKNELDKVICGLEALR